MNKQLFFILNLIILSLSLKAPVPNINLGFRNFAIELFSQTSLSDNEWRIWIQAYFNFINQQQSPNPIESDIFAITRFIDNNSNIGAELKLNLRDMVSAFAQQKNVSQDFLNLHGLL